MTLNTGGANAFNIHLHTSAERGGDTDKQTEIKVFVVRLLNHDGYNKIIRNSNMHRGTRQAHRDRNRDRNKERDRHIERGSTYRDGDRDKYRDRERHRWTGTETERQKQTHRDRHRHRHTRTGAGIDIQ